MLRTRHLAAALILSSGMLSASETWKSHTNPRFGIRVDYPAYLKPLAIAPNGSLHSFTDGSFTLTVQGHFLNGRTLEDHWKQALSDHGPSITYKVCRSTWFVVSGVRPDGTEFYRKFHVRGGGWAEFTATYPRRLNQRYDPVVAHIAKSFTPFLKGSFDRIP